MIGTDEKLRFYRVKNKNLHHASIHMNKVSTDTYFACRIVEIIPGDEVSVVGVAIKGSYPFVTNAWSGFTEEEE